MYVQDEINRIRTKYIYYKYADSILLPLLTRFYPVIYIPIYMYTYIHTSLLSIQSLYSGQDFADSPVAILHVQSPQPSTSTLFTAPANSSVVVYVRRGSILVAEGSEGEI